ncbi:MAG TPA: cbb3-type cytochrome c oxidase subunit I [Acetobacteraceae bacterium]|nr:cbb3-type cytochrome c oxidase subunit I [Acetobacteraceae bacterium]
MSITAASPAAIPADHAARLSLRRAALAFVLTAFAAMTVGSLLGPAQALNYANIDIYPALPVASYYQGLSIHGVLNGLVFTTFFNCAVLFYLPARELDVPARTGWVWLCFWVMLAGLALALIAILSNRATVLYTLYAPLEAWWPLYVGLALVVVGSLMLGAETLRMRLAWKRLNPGRVTPLAAYQASVVWILWAFTSIGIVVELVVFLIPWSLGLCQGVDPLITFTLFWYTGHAIVYFWVLPAYLSWYALLPREAGGRLVSDKLGRLTFLLFLLFSVEVGLHHEITAPGIAMFWKMEQMVFTFFVVGPSLLTAFTIAASLEAAGRAHGGRGWLGWLTALPWRDPSVAGQVLALITFIGGGSTGILLASMAINPLLHDTAFIPGHFHITVGTATALTFIAMSYWLVPHLTGRKLFAPKLALASVWLWAAGMMGIGIGLMGQGLLYGTPRRDFISSLPHDPFVHPGLMAVTAIAGVVLLIALLCFLVSTLGTLFSAAAPVALVPRIPFGDAPVDGESRLVLLMDRLGLWTIVSALLIAMVYLPLFWVLFQHYVAVPGNRMW